MPASWAGLLSCPSPVAPTSRSLLRPTPTRRPPLSRWGATTPICRWWPPASRRSRRWRCCRTRAPPSSPKRHHGWVLRVQRGMDPVLVTTVPVEATGPGGLSGLVLSPAYAEDRLVYADATTADDNRRCAGAPARSRNRSSRAFRGGRGTTAAPPATDGRNALLVATGSAGLPLDAGSLAGKLLQHRQHARPAGRGQPGPGVADLQLRPPRAPGGVCAEGSTVWVTDHPGSRDVLTGPCPVRSATRPGRGRTGPGGLQGAWCSPGCCSWPRPRRALVFVLRPDGNGTFTGAPETLLQNRYGRLAAAATAPDGLLWLGTTNKGSGWARGTQRRPGDPHPAAGGRGRVAAVGSPVSM